MTEKQIKLLILEVLEEVIYRNVYYKSEGESFDTNILKAIDETKALLDD
jgi:hypothetical protein